MKDIIFIYFIFYDFNNFVYKEKKNILFINYNLNFIYSACNNKL